MMSAARQDSNEIPAVITVNGLTKRFSETTAVNHIDFTVERGEILGKTTTIQLLLGLTTPTAGRINILGMDLRKNRRQVLQRVNFLPERVSQQNPYRLRRGSRRV